MISNLSAAPPVAATTIRPVPEDALSILNTLYTELQIPPSIRSLQKHLSITGSHPILPHPHKSQAYSTALFALLGLSCTRILQLRNSPEVAKDDFRIAVDSDQSTLFLVSFIHGEIGGFRALDGGFGDVVKGMNEESGEGLRGRLMELYLTKDNRYFMLHPSLHPSACLKALDLDPETPASPSEARKILEAKCLTHTAEELRQICVEARIVGDICLTPEEFDASEQGKVISHLPLSSLEPIPISARTKTKTTATSLSEPPPMPFPPFTNHSSGAKPLQGIRVIELTRVIAGPLGGRLLAELGASVVRVMDRKATDFSILQPEFSVDKKTVFLDLKSEDGQKQMAKLLEAADVFLQGYRPGAMDRLGLSHAHLATLSAKRGKGLIIIDESCYGGLAWQTPSSTRPGYQQIADTLTGLAWENAQAAGLPAPLIPCFPISDHCAGQLCALMAVLGLIRRTEEGGTVSAEVALTRVDLFERKLERYPDAWVKEMYEAGPRMAFDWGFFKLAAAQTKHMREVAPHYFKKGFFETVEAWYGGQKYEFEHLAPVIIFKGIDSSGRFLREFGTDSVNWD